MRDADPAKDPALRRFREKADFARWKPNAPDLDVLELSWVPIAAAGAYTPGPGWADREFTREWDEALRKGWSRDDAWDGKGPRVLSKAAIGLTFAGILGWHWNVKDRL